MRRIAWIATGLLALALATGARAAGEDERVTLTLRDIEIGDVMQMLSRTHRVNILLDDAVTGTVSLNLYDMTVEDAIHAIASASGYAVEQRWGSWFVIPRSDVGRHSDGGVTSVRTFRVQYSDTEQVAEILEDYTSVYGQVTAFADRKLVVVQDQPAFVRRIADLVAILDREPRQVLIEARILEVALDDAESWGIDWRHLFDTDKGSGSFGSRDLAANGAQGFFLEVMNTDVEVIIDALMTDGRARTLSTPKLLTLEDEPASVIVGDRKGYRVTTTINQITTESIEFLESGVILRVTPSVDERGRIRLSVQPEISTGSVSEGIPSQVTTSVNTELLLENGQTSFIAGLIKKGTTQRQSGLPVLGKLPIIGRAFRNESRAWTNTETIVLITPRLVDSAAARAMLEDAEAALDASVTRIGPVTGGTPPPGAR